MVAGTIFAVLSPEGWLDPEAHESDLRGSRGVALAGVLLIFMGVANFRNTVRAPRHPPTSSRVQGCRACVHSRACCSFSWASPTSATRCAQDSYSHCRACMHACMRIMPCWGGFPVSEKAHEALERTGASRLPVPADDLQAPAAFVDSGSAWLAC